MIQWFNDLCPILATRKAEDLWHNVAHCGNHGYPAVIKKMPSAGIPQVRMRYNGKDK